MTNIIGAPTLDGALAFLTALVSEGEKKGERITVFCEDKLTLLAERAAVLRTKGSFTTSVTSFARFLKGDRAILSKQGSVMEISAILSEHESELLCFKKNAAQAVYETIAQLLSSRADAELLRRSAAETEGMLSRKLTDLARILELYTDFLREKGLLDENGYLALLPEKIEAELKGSHIVFFAFPSFTQRAMEGVRAALQYGGKVTGIFLAGKEAPYTNEALRSFRAAAEEMGETGVMQLRSDLTGDASYLAEGLFSPEVYGRKPEKREHIHLFREADEGEELETVCALIKKHVIEDGLRYRDFAVLLPAPDRFLQAERMLADFSIPFFSDRKRPFSEHPFCRFALDVLGCVQDGGRPDSVDAVLSSVYFGQADNYRNYLLKYGGYRGAVNREIKEGVKGYDLAELAAARQRLRALLSLFPREGRGSKYIAAVRSLYEAADGEKVTEKLAGSFCGAEKEFLDLSPLEGILGEIGSLAGERKFTAAEFGSVLRSGLEAKEISMIPQSSDAVFVGDATDSRFSRVKVLFLVGADDTLPRVSGDTAVITDGEIKRLQSLSLEIEPQICVVNTRAKESLYLNLCSFSKELYVSCPLRVRGEEARRGEAFLCIDRMVFGAPMSGIPLYKSCERAPALRNLFRLKEDFEEGKAESSVWFSSLQKMLFDAGELSNLPAGGGKGPSKNLSSLLFQGQISPSLLEAYFGCPYKSFMTFGLRLREREERSALDTDTGSFVHTVLQQVAPRFNELGTEEDCRALAEQTARELLISPRYAFLADTGAGLYTGERLVRECGVVTAECFRQIRYSKFSVEGTEREITIPALGLVGRTDRVDVSDGYVRVIDYKTGEIDDTPAAYYTGRKLQLELYLLAAAEGKIPAGAFYFPAQERFCKEEEAPFRMKGFFAKDEDVLSRMDTLRTEGKSFFFEGGGRSEKGLPQEEFRDFLWYALLVSDQALKEMKGGNISPSPYDGTCKRCNFMGMCCFSGESRKESSLSCKEIAAIVRAERSEE